MSKVDVTKRYKTPKAVLRATYKLFKESKSNWTRHQNEKERQTANGGVAFCARGAISNFADDYATLWVAEAKLRDALGGRQAVTEVNDKKGYKAIMAGLEKAIG